MGHLDKAGGYKAQHFIDYAGDGWIEARCPQLASEIPTRLPAYCTSMGRVLLAALDPAEAALRLQARERRALTAYTRTRADEICRNAYVRSSCSAPSRDARIQRRSPDTTRCGTSG